MANHAYLNLWFRDFTIERGLAHLEALLTLFPVSAARPGFRLVIRSLDPAQSSSLEADMLAVPAAVRKLAGQFLHNDTSYEVSAWWDLWRTRAADTPAPGWRQEPSPVEIVLHGEEFDEARFRESGHVVCNLGFDHLYLGSPQTPGQAARRYLRENVRRLYGYLRQIEKSLPLAERRLWSEGEENFGARTESLLSAS